MKFRELLSISALGLLLAACGGGSSSSGTPGGGTGGGGTGGGTGGGGTGGGTGGGPIFGIDAGGLAYGVITSFGSVIVNGVRYDTASTDVFVNGAPAAANELRVGDVVAIEGELASDGVNGTARSIRADSIVEGAVESIDLDAGVIVVLGQAVDVSPNTSFDDDFSPRNLEGIAVGMRVEVDGFIGAEGRIQGTRIELDDDSEFEVRGVVADLDPTASTFRINDLVVNYGAALLDGFPTSGISNGHLVEVEGAVFQDGVLEADEVDFEGDFLRRLCSDDDDSDCGVDLEGFISRFVSAADFDVGGVRVAANAGTVYEDGTVADLALGQKVQVWAVVEADGSLTAVKIEFDDDNSPVEIGANVSAVDAANSVITLLGIRVQFDAQTKLEDFSSALAFPFRPENIQVGDRIKIAGRPVDSAVADILATKLEREDDDSDDVELTGFVSDIAAPVFTILGVTIQTGLETQFEGRSGEVSSDDFFAELQVGDLVEADGVQLAETVIAADQVEIENDDSDDD